VLKKTAEEPLREVLGAKQRRRQGKTGLQLGGGGKRVRLCEKKRNDRNTSGAGQKIEPGKKKKVTIGGGKPHTFWGALPQRKLQMVK